MKFIRFKNGNRVSYGILENQEVIAVQGSVFEDYRELPEKFSLEEVQLLAPCVPGKVLCAGLNYRDHAEEMGLPIPKWPVIFMKPGTSVIGPGEEIVYPGKLVTRLDYEGELAVVIKKTARDVDENEVKDFILGYTCGNDITARNLQPKEGQWTVAKGFDTFMPLGPAIVSDISPEGRSIVCTLNGEIKQQSNTNNFIFPVPYLVSYLSKIMTLLPGDVIITGTPSGIGPMNPGDVVSVSIEGVGTLTNRVIRK